MLVLWGELYISLVKMQRPSLRGYIGSRRMPIAFNSNDVPASGEESTNWLFSSQLSPELTPLQCFSCPLGFGPSQLKRSEHHYSRISYLKTGSINLWILPWLDSGVHQPPIFPLVNPLEHLTAGTQRCIVQCLGECSLSCFSMRSGDQ